MFFGIILAVSQESMLYSEKRRHSAGLDFSISIHCLLGSLVSSHFNMTHKYNAHICYVCVCILVSNDMITV